LQSKNINIEISRTIILPVVLCGCETWSLAYREEHRVRLYENRVLRRIFEPKWDEITGEWRKIHNKELNHMYPWPKVIRVIKSRRKRWVWHIALVVERRGAYRVWWGHIRKQTSRKTQE
jgi:hypothetical protein